MKQISNRQKMIVKARENAEKYTMMMKKVKKGSKKEEGRRKKEEGRSNRELTAES